MLRARVPDKLKELVEKFRLNEDHYKSQSFLETQVRVEFINPLLRILGWDVDNEAGHAQEYKDVIHELHSGDGRHIDYVFKVGGEKKFLIEAKRPSEDVANNKLHAMQAKGYAYKEKIPLVILTDFEEFSIYLGYRAYDREPASGEGVEHRRVFYCRYTDLPRYWSFLYSLLSKKSVMLGLHDHLLKRLDEVKSKISESVYAVGEFNLLYSIAQSFGGEDYSVEQDIEIDETPQTAPLLHAADVPVAEFPTRSLRVTEKSISQFAPAFYLKPLYS